MSVVIARSTVTPRTGSAIPPGHAAIPITLRRPARSVFPVPEKYYGVAEPEKKDSAWIVDLTYCRRSLKRGESLYRAADKFAFIYLIHSGFFKTEQMLEDGRHQVIEFHMPGEMMGLEAIEHDAHTCNAVALENSEVCVIPYSRLSDTGPDGMALQRQFHKAMSHAIGRQHSVMLLLGAMRAGERVARFLLNLSERLAARGYSHSEFYLRMTRRDIGSHLGMKLETVSRTLSKFHKAGFIDVDQKHIRILDIAGLEHWSTEKSSDASDDWRPQLTKRCSAVTSIGLMKHAP